MKASITKNERAKNEQLYQTVVKRVFDVRAEIAFHRALVFSHFTLQPAAHNCLSPRNYVITNCYAYIIETLRSPRQHEPPNKQKENKKENRERITKKRNRSSKILGRLQTFSLRSI